AHVLGARGRKSIFGMGGSLHGERTEPSLALEALAVKSRAEIASGEPGVASNCWTRTYCDFSSLCRSQSINICSFGLSYAMSRWRMLRPLTKWQTSSARFLA